MNILSIFIGIVFGQIHSCEVPQKERLGLVTFQKNAVQPYF